MPSDPTSHLDPNFRDMLGLLLSGGAKFLVVGGFAMAAHDRPRYTGDIDIWVRPDPSNAARVWEALLRFGAPLSGMSIEDFASPGVVYQMGVPPARIDIMTSIQAVEFDEAWEARVDVELDGMKVHFLGREHLLQNKESVR